MDPSTLEAITMLDKNIQEIALAAKRGRRDDEEDVELEAYESDSDDEDGAANIDLRRCRLSHGKVASTHYSSSI
jgi:hypothetical protein